MYEWFFIDLFIVLAYGFQHTLLTTKIAVDIFNTIFPPFLWNIVYSVISVLTLIAGFYYWQKSEISLFHLVPGSLAYHISLVLLALSLFFFFYCFKYTTSFWQWLGVKQVIFKISGNEMPAYYRVRKDGIKKYIRFPHHTCLIFFFWTHPVMTLDTLFLAVSATIYLYVGTYHQDLRGLRVIGDEWKDYRINTNLLLPSINTVRRMLADWKLSRH